MAAGAADTPAWRVEVVDQSGAGRFTSLKADRSGNLHLAYVVADGRNTLKYAFRDRNLGRWFTMPLAVKASFCSLVLDSKERPRIAYADEGTISGAKLRYVNWDGQSWQSRAIPVSSDVVGYYTSIVLDSQDNPSISFYEYRGPRGSDIRIRLRVVSWTGQYWESRLVDSDEGSGKFNAMAIDPQGRLHLAYANVTTATAGMRYAYWDGRVWNLEHVEGQAENNGEYVGYSAIVALDEAGTPHLSYMNTSSPGVKYAVRRDGLWHTELVDTVSRVGYPDRNSLVVDASGRPFIGYYDAGVGLLKLARREAQGWVSEVVDGDGCGFTSSLQIDHGTIWISYTDGANGGVKVAYKELAEVGAPPPVQTSAVGRPAEPSR